MPILAPLFDHPRDAVAAIVGAERITYARLCGDVHRAAAFLKSQGVGPGATVGIYVGRFHGPADYSNWIAHLAAIRVGATHASVHDGPSLARLAKRVRLDALVGTAPDQTGPFDLRLIGFDLDSMAPVAGSEDAEASAVRLNLTSGTTGEAKVIPWDRAMMAARIDQVADVSPIGPATRLDSMLAPRTTAGFRYPLAVWRAGGAVILSENLLTAEKRMPATQSTLLVCSPFQLRQLGPGRPWPGRQARTVVALGGRVPTGVRDWALANIAARVLISYGSTEAGNVASGDTMLADRHPGAVGWIREGVDVEIAGEDGSEVAAGEPGMIRIRSQVQAAEVGTDDEDGWFEPGDRAIMFEDGLLAIEGRSSDVMNLAGLKLSATNLEARLTAVAGVKDAGIALLRSADRDVIGIAVVAADGVRGAQLLPAIRPIVPGGAPFSLTLLGSIPRNAMGKIDRNRLTEEIVAQKRSAQDMRHEHA